jgi:predicted ArsR family transcriptional regulator
MSHILIPKVGKARRAEAIEILKRSGGGLPVKALASELGLSYMGTKEICRDLEKAGYLDTFRSPSSRGRPQVLYRLTRKADELFPAPAVEPLRIMLEASAKLFGPTAPAKLLLSYFQEKTARGKKQVSGETLEERLKSLARWRDDEGHYASIQEGNPPSLLERNQPLQKLYLLYPETLRMEEQMLGNILGCSMRREENLLEEGGLQRFIPVL